MEPNFHQRSLDGYEKLKITKIFNNKVDEQANNSPGGCEVISVVYACAVCNHIPSIRRMTQDASKILATKKSHRARRVMQLLWYTHLKKQGGHCLRACTAKNIPTSTQTLKHVLNFHRF